MSQKGFVMLDRALMDHFLWQEKPFSRGQAWVDMLFLANWRERDFFKRGIKVNVKRGQIAISIKGLSDRWGWSQGKVKRFLECLKNEEQIEYQTSKLTTLITLKNYEKYQVRRFENGEQTENRRGTDGEQTETPEEVKEIKDKGAAAPPDQDSMWGMAERMGIPKSLVGKEVKKHGKEEVCRAIGSVWANNPAEPKAYFLAALNSKSKIDDMPEYGI